MSAADEREIPLSKGLTALVDEADHEWLSQWKWASNGNGYAVRHRCRSDGPGASLVLMHRVIMNAPAGLTVDHINRNKTDNRRSNLRLCTQAENVKNQGLTAANTTGFKGVVPRPESGRFQARLCCDEKTYTSRYFNTAVGAALAYDSMAREIHGEYAGLNFPDMQVEWPWRTGTGERSIPGRVQTLRLLGALPRRTQRPDLADDLVRRLATGEQMDLEEIVEAARAAVYGPLRTAA